MSTNVVPLQKSSAFIFEPESFAGKAMAELTMHADISEKKRIAALVRFYLYIEKCIFTLQGAELVFTEDFISDVRRFSKLAA